MIPIECIKNINTTEFYAIGQEKDNEVEDKPPHCLSNELVGVACNLKKKN